MPDEITRASPDNEREEVREQPDPALQITTGRLGVVGWAIFFVIVIVVLSAVLYGLNGPSETSSQARSQSGAQNTANSTAPTPTAPQNGPGARP